MPRIKLWPDKDVVQEKITIKTGKRYIKALVIKPKDYKGGAACVLWIHGGGFATGMKEMAYMTRAIDLVKQYGVVVVSPGYRLSWQAPYPAALKDCYATLLYIKKHAKELDIRDDQIMVGGESAGGSLCAALCMLARDKKSVNIAYQMPFYDETLLFVKKLKEAGVEAEVDIYEGLYHSFDLYEPASPITRKAVRKFLEHFEYALGNYFAPQMKNGTECFVNQFI